MSILSKLKWRKRQKYSPSREWQKAGEKVVEEWTMGIQQGILSGDVWQELPSNLDTPHEYAQIGKTVYVRPRKEIDQKCPCGRLAEDDYHLCGHCVRVEFTGIPNRTLETSSDMTQPDIRVNVIESNRDAAGNDLDDA